MPCEAMAHSTKYNLICTSLGILQPALLNMQLAVSWLHHILHKWSEVGYKINLKDLYEQNIADVVMYLLHHDYSRVMLQMGAFKRTDRHMIVHLKGMAKDLGFLIFLSHLGHVVAGSAKNYH